MYWGRYGFLLAIIFALAPNAGLAAEQVDIEANSGKTMIYSFLLYNKFSCAFSELPNYKIRTPAQNGELSAEVVKARFNADHKRCAGKRVYVLEINYRPKRGYRGSDKAIVDLRFPTYSSLNFQTNRTIKFDITVK